MAAGAGVVLVILKAGKAAPIHDKKQYAKDNPN
jgi:hypothetical protein